MTEEKRRNGRGTAGFTLIELLVVVLIIGVLASIAIPQYFKVLERTRMGEVLNGGATIQGAQERAIARGGSYTNDFAQLDVQIPDVFGNPMTGATGSAKYYIVGLNVVNPNYTMTWTRYGSPPSRYGSYVMTYTCGPSQPCTPVATYCGTSPIGVCQNELAQ